MSGTLYSMSTSERLSDIAVRPEGIFKNARTTQDKLTVLADVYADCRTWIYEDSEDIASLKASVRQLKHDIAELQNQPENDAKTRVFNDARC